MDPSLDTESVLRGADACAVSDALDRVGLAGVAQGLRPLTAARRMAGRVVPVRLGPPVEGAAPPARHLGTAAILQSAPGDVIVVANDGRVDCAGWGGNLARAAKIAGVAGVIVDGACRDIDEADELGFVVFAREATPRTARGRVVELATSSPVTIAGIDVAPGDFVVADGSGVVFVPADAIEDVANAAAEIMAKEALMARAIDGGVPVDQVMGASYERMLEAGS